MARRSSDNATVQPRMDSSGQFRFGLDKFLEEAQTLARFRHPNIVRVTQFLETNGTAYLVMDYVEGESLNDYLKRNRNPVSEAQLKAWFMPILQGLITVHAAGFLHRDIKPGNIYLRDNGEPVLIDFGAARQAIGEHSKSVTGIFTAGYAPTEQYGTDAKKQGPWTDLYAIGATLYRCIAGQTPIDAPTRQSALVEGDKDPLVPARVKGAEHYSPAFLQLLDELLVLPIKERPQTVAPVLAALAAGRSVSGRESYAAETVLAEKLGSAEAETVVVSDHHKAPTPKKPIPPQAAPAKGVDEPPKKGVNLKVLGVIAALVIVGLLVTTLVSYQRNAAEAQSRTAAQAAEQLRLAVVAKEEAEVNTKAEAAKRAEAAAQAQARELADAKAQAEAQARELAAANARADAKERELTEAKAQADAKAQAEAKAQADAQMRAQAEEKAQAQAQAKAQAAAQAKPYILVEAGAGVLRQPSSGLEWTQSDNGADINWGNAGSYCAGKGSGWRLPSTAELLSLYDASGAVSTSCGAYTCKVSPLFRLSSFWFWSNEANGSSEAWYVVLGDGGRYSGAVAGTFSKRALCVRRS